MKQINSKNRGIKELDLLIGNWAHDNIDNLNNEELREMQEMLNLV